jgi:hypothetical protein
MKFLLSCILVFITLTSYAQTKTDTNYLLLHIVGSYDNTNKRNYLIINAEIGCDAAVDIYKLKVYDNKKQAINNDAVFYTDKTDSLKEMYNYFYSSTEILNYLSKKGFTLVTVYNDIFSSYNNQRNSNGDLVPITTVSSRPVFCFKK